MRKKTWYQFHLSTACIVLVATGTLLGLNFHVWRGGDYFVNYYGWPSAMHFPYYTEDYGRWIPSNVSANLIFCLGIIFFLFIFLECKVRKLKADSFSFPKSFVVQVKPLRLSLSLCGIGYIWGKFGERAFESAIPSEGYVGLKLLIIACMMLSLVVKKRSPKSMEESNKLK